MPRLSQNKPLGAVLRMQGVGKCVVDLAQATFGDVGFERAAVPLTALARIFHQAAGLTPLLRPDQLLYLTEQP